MFLRLGVRYFVDASEIPFTMWAKGCCSTLVNWCQILSYMLLEC